MVGGFGKSHGQRHEFIIQIQETHEGLKIIILSTFPGCFSLPLGLTCCETLSKSLLSSSLVAIKVWSQISNVSLTLEFVRRANSQAPPTPPESETKLWVVKVTCLSARSLK